MRSCKLNPIYCYLRMSISLIFAGLFLCILSSCNSGQLSTKQRENISIEAEKVADDDDQKFVYILAETTPEYKIVKADSRYWIGNAYLVKQKFDDAAGTDIGHVLTPAGNRKYKIRLKIRNRILSNKLRVKVYHDDDDHDHNIAPSANTQHETTDVIIDPRDRD